MARSSQTQQKRQRENKLREKAQLKRDRRQQRQAEKKLAQAQEPQALNESFLSVEATDGNLPALESAGTDAIITQAVDPDHGPTVWTSTQANPEGTPPI